MNKKEKKGRYQNITILILSIFIIFYSIKVINNQYNLSGFSLFTYTNFVFGYPTLILGFSSTLLALYVLIKKAVDNNIKKIKNIIYYILIVLIFLYIIEFILLSTLNSFIHVSTLTKMPGKEEFLNSITYIVINYLDDFLKGVLITLELSLIGTVIGLILGLIFVIIRTLKINNNDGEFVAFLKKVGIVFTKVYVNVFRGTPMMVQALIIYYLLPVLIAGWLNIPQANVDKFFTITISALIIVSLNTTAYLTEVLRGGIESLDKGQLEAARSLGMGYWQSMFNVVLPQAIKNSLPSIFNEFIINIKDTSVLNVIGVAELFFIAQDVRFRFYRTYEPFIIAALIYLFLTLSASKLLAYIERKMNVEAKPLPSSN